MFYFIRTRFCTVIFEILGFPLPINCMRTYVLHASLYACSVHINLPLESLYCWNLHWNQLSSLSEKTDFILYHVNYRDIFKTYMFMYQHGIITTTQAELNKNEQILFIYLFFYKIHIQFVNKQFNIQISNVQTCS